MAPRYSSYYTSDEREGPFEQGFEGAYVKPAVDPSDAVAVAQYPAAIYPSLDGLVNSLEPGYQKMIQGQLRTLDQQALAKQQKFENLTFNDKFDNEEDQIGQAIGKTLLALLPIAGGYILGGDRLAAAGAGAGLGGLKTFEDQVAQEEKMGEKKKAIIAKQYAAEMEALAKQKEQIVDRAFKDQDTAKSRQFQIDDREDQQKNQWALQRDRQSFERQLKETFDRKDAVVSPEEIEQVAQQWMGMGESAKADQMMIIAQQSRAGVPMTRSAFAAYLPQRPQPIADPFLDKLAKAEAAALESGRLATQLNKVTGKPFAELITAGRIPTNQISVVRNTAGTLVQRAAQADLSGVLTQQDVQTRIDSYLSDEMIATGQGLRNVRADIAGSIVRSLNLLDMKLQQPKFAADAKAQKDRYIAAMTPVAEALGIPLEREALLALYYDQDPEVDANTAYLDSLASKLD